ncbi:MAG: DUF4179 domain-containing protein [Clostridium sp.]
MKKFEKIEIDEKDFDYIKEDLTEIDKEKMKRMIRGKIKEQQQSKKIKKSIAASITFLLFLGITSTPAIASNIPFIDGIYKNLGFYNEYLDYTDCIGKSVEENGIKITVDNIVGTKYKFIVSIKIESEEKLSDEFNRGLFVTASVGDEPCNSSKSTNSYPNENTIMKVIEIDNYSGFSKRDVIKINVKSGGFIDTSLSFAVDFTKSFEQKFEEKVNKDIECISGTVKNIESNIIGTTIKIESNKVIEEGELLPKLLLKIDDKVFISDQWAKEGKDIRYEFRGATYPIVEGYTNISIIPLTSELTMEERWGVESINKVIENELGITYDKFIEFNDGTTGEVYKIERKEDIVRIYYKGETEKHSILLASGLALWKDQEDGYKPYYGTLDKDPNESLGYVAEFTGVNEEEKLMSVIDKNISVLDKYKFEDEIKIK